MILSTSPLRQWGLSILGCDKIPKVNKITKIIQKLKYMKTLRKRRGPVITETDLEFAKINLSPANVQKNFLKRFF